MAIRLRPVLEMMAGRISRLELGDSMISAEAFETRKLTQLYASVLDENGHEIYEETDKRKKDNRDRHIEKNMKNGNLCCRRRRSRCDNCGC